MTIRRELIDELLKDYETPQEILGEGGLLKDLRHRGARTLPGNRTGDTSRLSQPWTQGQQCRECA